MAYVHDRLLRLLLRQQPHFLSGEEISRQLGISRAAIWKQIQELRKEGYEIESRTRNGYRLLYRPDRVAPEEILSHLETDTFGREIRYHTSASSTQILAHQWARAGAPHGALVVAEEQETGRGRMGRTWHSPPYTGIWMSLILQPEIPLYAASHFPILASLGVQRGIDQMTGLPVAIKWPNDLLLHKRKFCGILTEMRAEQDRIHYLILGVGINVNMQKSDLPVELQEQATSLREEMGDTIHRASLIARILYELETIYQNYTVHGFAPIQQEWEEKADHLLGQEITAKTPQDFVTGIAEGLHHDGALRIRTSEGVRSIYSADLLTPSP